MLNVKTYLEVAMAMQSGAIVEISDSGSGNHFIGRIVNLRPVYSSGGYSNREWVATVRYPDEFEEVNVLFAEA